MLDKRTTPVSAVYIFMLVFGSWAIVHISTSAQAQQKQAQASCVDYSDDPANCQPSTFDAPIGQIPDHRIGRDGKINPKSSEADVRAGAALLENRLHLFRNFTPIHWVVTAPSVPDPVTGGWTGGDLDVMGDGRGLGIAGNCIYVGHANGAIGELAGAGSGGKRGINIYKIQPDPVKDQPVQVGEIPAWTEGSRGFDEKELRSLVYTTSSGQQRQILVRIGSAGVDGRQITFDINMQTCLPSSESNIHYFGAQGHEFYLWHDPNNPNRVLIYTTIWSPAVPDPNFPGRSMADLDVMAITDEKTGDVLKDPKIDATFTLEDTGGPGKGEKPDATGLYSDGRFIDYSVDKDLSGVLGNFNKSEQNMLHSISISDDGERAYAAGSTSGFYVLNTEAIAHSTDADLAAGTAGCNLHTTMASAKGRIDASKLSALANDCVHMVINDDPGVKAYLASDASPEAKTERYMTLATRSRFDPYPPFNAVPTGTHSAVIIPGRPAEVRGNTKGRPAYVWLSDENEGCPLNYGRIMSVEQEAFPAMVGAFALPVDKLDNCLHQANTEPDGVTRRRPFLQINHNPTVFKDLVFVAWLGQGLRAIDISNPMTPREVGHVNPAPASEVRTYPVFKDGLLYWNDLFTGLHVVKYTGPYANEIPSKGVYEGNATSPHP